MRFLSANAQHIGARSYQQDSFGFGTAEPEFVEHGGLAAIVCDGMGGMEHGDAASRVAVGAFLSAYEDKLPSESVPEALLRSTHYANDQVALLAQGLNLLGGVGTTLVAAAVLPGGFHYISVGDSGIFQCAEGRAKLVNYPHVFANYLEAAVAAGKMSVETALLNPERESLTSYIGIENLQEIDASAELIALLPGESVLLASDGLFKTLLPEEFEGSLLGFPPEWPGMLVKQVIACQHVSQDNVTVLTVTLEDEGRPLDRTSRVKVAKASGPPPLPPV